MSGSGDWGAEGCFLSYSVQWFLFNCWWDEWILAKDLMKITVAYWCSLLLFLLVSVFPFAACVESSRRIFLRAKRGECGKVEPSSLPS